MQGLSGPQEAGAWRFRRLAIAAALIVFLFAVALLSPVPDKTKLVVTGLGLVGGALAMAVGFWRRSRLTSGRRRLAWILFTATGLLSALSNFLLISSELVSPEPDRAPSDLALTVALLVAIVGLATFPSARRRTTDLIRMVLDGIVLGGSTLFVATVTVFPRILDHTTGSSAFLLTVPVFDIVIATVATLLFLRGAPQDRPTLGLFATGCVCYAVSDFVFAVIFSEQGSFTFGTITDLGWIAGFALIALAARSPGSGATPVRARLVEPSPVAGTLVMFALFLVAALLSLKNMITSDRLSSGSAVLWLVVLLAVLTRQIFLIVDNDRLRQSLEIVLPRLS